MSSPSGKFIPPEFIPRIEKFLDKLISREIDEAKFIGLIEALIRPALMWSNGDPELRAALERQCKLLSGVRMWINAKGQNPIIIEVTELPELLKFHLASKDEVKKLDIPGVSYDPLLLKDALAGKFNPFIALASGRIAITGLTELVKIGAPLFTALKPFREKENVIGELRREVLSALDKLLVETGC
ncbi:MAG: hypothetical protein QXJ75_04930 [Candidatus Bathyarchaeia archaeon]